MAAEKHSSEVHAGNSLEGHARHREALDEQADVRRLSARVARFMAEAAFQEFPGLKDMSADQIREFGNVVTRDAADFSVKAANLAHRAKEQSWGRR